MLRLLAVLALLAGGRAGAHELVLEAEEFVVVKGPWRVLNLGENYYAATLANTFISRQRLLGAPAQGPVAEAARTADIPAAGSYRVWSRYENPSRWSVEHTIRIEQRGKVVLERKYGATSNPKVWPMGKGLVPMAEFPWGSGDNLVWEPSDQLVALEAGPAKITLIAGPQPEAAMSRGGAARRNLDALLLTDDATFGLVHPEKNTYHSIDRVLSQRGECWLRVGNPARATAPLGVDLLLLAHNPYWQPRDPLPKTKIEWLAPGASSEWIAIGQALDTTNMQELALTSRYQGASPPRGSDLVVELARDPLGKRLLRKIEYRNAESSRLLIEIPHDLRGPNPIVRTVEEWHEVLAVFLRSLSPITQPPREVPVLSVMLATNHPAMKRARDEAARLLGRDPTQNVLLDVRGLQPDKLRTHLEELRAKGALDGVTQVSLGDEIGIGAGVPIPPPNDPAAAARYWPAYRADLDRGIDALAQLTRVAEEVIGPGVHVGANFSPHPQYFPTAGKWVRPFRRHGMTMPWSEDWVFQVPETSMMTTGYLVDVMRAAARPGDQLIHLYNMPHWPGQTARDFTLSVYSSLAHGNRVLDFYGAVPIYDYTENWVAWEAYPTWRAIHDVVRDVGLADRMIASGRVRRAQVAMVVSEANDVWEIARGQSIFNFERKNLWYALRHAQVAIDFVDESDLADPKVMAGYAVVISVGDHLERRAAAGLRDWVAQGGALIGIAAGELRDELDAPLPSLKEVYGVGAAPLTLTEKNCWVKECLAWLEPLAEIRELDGRAVRIPALAALATLESARDAQVLARFDGGKPAVLQHTFKKGTATLFGFFPGTAYLQQAIPRRPFDRGASDDNFNHFLPTDVNRDAARLVLARLAAAGVTLEARASTDGGRELALDPAGAPPPLDLGILDSPLGTAIPIANYSGHPLPSLTLTLHAHGPFREVVAARAGKLTPLVDGDRVTVTLPLDWADLVMFVK